MKAKFKIISLRHRLVSLLIVISILFSSMLLSLQTVYATSGGWENNVSQPTEGDGSSQNPYIISSAEELAYVIKNGGEGKNYKLKNDIYLSDVDKINFATGNVSNGYSVKEWFSTENSNPFSGTIDGDGHTVYGMYAVNNNNTDSLGLGLIPGIEENTTVIVKNLGIDKAYISSSGSNSCVSAFAGFTKWNNTVSFSECYVGGDVTVVGKRAAAFCAYGGSALNISNSYSLAVLNGSENKGLFGDCWSTTVIRNSYIAKAPVTTKYVGTNCDYSNVYTDTDGFYGILRTTDNMQGVDSVSSETKMNGLGAAFKAKSSYPVLKIFESAAESTSGIWDGTIASGFTEGDGSQNNPYIISTAEELAYLVKNWPAAAYYYQLKNDIYLNDVDKMTVKSDGTVSFAGGYTPTEWFTTENSNPFYGVFDGNGYTVYGLYVKNDADTNDLGLALFPAIQSQMSTTVKNLGIDKAYINSSGQNSCAAAFVGHVRYGSEYNISNCYVGANVSVTGKRAAAFYAYGDGTLNMENCYSLATLSGTEQSGLFADSWGSLTIKNTFIVNAPVSTKYIGENCSCTNVYSSFNGFYGQYLTVDNMQGQDVFTNADKMPNINGDTAFLPTANYPTLKVFSKEIPDASNAWDGTVTAPTGEGTENKPIEISTPNQLAYIIKNGGEGKYYKLTADIYFNDIEKINWVNGKVTNNHQANIWYTSDDTAEFNGNIDGDGHTVYGIYYNAESDKNVALIPKTANGQSITVKNLGIDNAYISTSGNAAAFISQHNAFATVNSCFAGENVVLKGKDTGVFFASGGAGFDASDAYSLATLTATANSGLFGDNWAADIKISNIYLAKNVTVSTKVNNNLVYSNVYTNIYSDIYQNCKVVSDADMKGLDVFSNASKMVLLGASKAFQQTNGYPILRIFSDDPNYDPDEPEGDIWSGKVTYKFAAGLGTEDNPYIISNGAELAYAIVNNGFNGAYFKLSNDIYLNDVSTKDWQNNTDNNVWVSSDGFNGNIDGCGYIVYGIWYPEDTKQENSGLIPSFNSGTIKNIGVRYSYVRGTVNAGGIVGITLNGNGVKKVIDSCFADDTVTVAYTSNKNGGAAGILGQAGFEESNKSVLDITNCYSKATVLGNDSNRVNGIIGTSWLCAYTMSSCYSVGQAPYNAVNEYVCSNLNKAGIALKDIYKNIYTDQRKANSYELWEFTVTEDMLGNNAKTSMPGLDYSKFETVNGATPKLKIFKSISGENIDLSGDSEVYASGKGTAESPYIISNAAQLKYLLESSNTKGKYYELSNDIYINDVSRSNWYLNNPVVWYNDKNSETFMGSFDGKGHSIHGLFVGETPTPYSADGGFAEGAVALFPTASTVATIRNTHIRNSNIQGKAFAAAIVGKITNSDNGLYLQVIGCSADETVKISGQVVGGIVGGGTDRGLKLHYSYFTGTAVATAEDRQNALVGDIWGFDWEMLQCYFLNYSAHRSAISPNLCAGNYGDYAMPNTKYLTAEQMTGKAAKENMKDFDWDTVWYTADGKTPQLKVISKDWVMKIFDEGVKGRAWSGYCATKYAGGNGTESDPYLIETPEQLAYLIDRDKQSEGKYYKLTADIKINDTASADWKKTAIEWLSGSNVFRGHFDGNGHVVSGMYYDTAFANVGLFQFVSSNAVIEKVGVIKSYIKNTGSELNASYSGALCAMITGWDLAEYTAPVFDQCFADHTVYIEGYTVGGLIGGNGMYIKMSNCYFTGELKGEKYMGQAIANTWNTQATYINNSYFLSKDASVLSDNLGSAGIVLENVYHRGTRGMIDGAVSIGTMLIRGEKARTYMPELDYDKIWLIVDGGNPVLRCFENAKQYSDTSMPEKVEITFASLGGSACESVFGYPLYSELTLDMLPTPERYGYKFEGWYYFSGCYLPVESGLFPDYDTVFYAKWTPIGFTVDFEGDLDSNYDFNAGAQHFKPGTSGYMTRYVNGGLKAMRMLSESDVAPCFLLSYENTLEVGQVYEIKFNILTDSADVTDTTLKLIHANHPQIDSDAAGYENIEVTNLKNGIYTECKATVTANSPYLLIETLPGVSVWFDDIQVVPQGKTGEIGNIQASGTNAARIDNRWIAIVVFAAVIAVAAPVTVVLLKKRKNKV